MTLDVSLRSELYLLPFCGDVELALILVTAMTLNFVSIRAATFHLLKVKGTVKQLCPRRCVGAGSSWALEKRLGLSCVGAGTWIGAGWEALCQFTVRVFVKRMALCADACLPRTPSARASPAEELS